MSLPSLKTPETADWFLVDGEGYIPAEDVKSVTAGTQIKYFPVAEDDWKNRKSQMGQYSIDNGMIAYVEKETGTIRIGSYSEGKEDVLIGQGYTKSSFELPFSQGEVPVNPDLCDYLRLAIDRSQFRLGTHWLDVTNRKMYYIPSATMGKEDNKSTDDKGLAIIGKRGRYTPKTYNMNGDLVCAVTERGRILVSPWSPNIGDELEALGYKHDYDLHVPLTGGYKLRDGTDNYLQGDLERLVEYNRSVARAIAIDEGVKKYQAEAQKKNIQPVTIEHMVLDGIVFAKKISQSETIYQEAGRNHDGFGYADYATRLKHVGEFMMISGSTRTPNPVFFINPEGHLCVAEGFDKNIQALETSGYKKGGFEMQDHAVCNLIAHGRANPMCYNTVANAILQGRAAIDKTHNVAANAGSIPELPVDHQLKEKFEKIISQEKQDPQRSSFG